MKLDKLIIVGAGRHRCALAVLFVVGLCTIGGAQSVSSLTLNPATVVGGLTSTGTVTLTSAAPTGGTVVPLTSQNPSKVTVPASVKVAAGAKTATFSIETLKYSGNYTNTVKAGTSTTNKSATLTVQIDGISTFTVTPTVLAGGQTAVGTVSLAEPAPSGGWTLKLSSSNSELASVPGTLSFPFGQSTEKFQIATKPWNKAQIQTVTIQVETPLQGVTFHPIQIEWMLENSAWPKFRQGEQNTGFGTGSGALGTTAWTSSGAFILPAPGVFASSPVIDSNNNVYIGCNDGNLYSFSGATGALNWTYPGKGAIKSTPAIDWLGNIYFCDAKGYVYSLDTLTFPYPTLNWKFYMGPNPITTSPTLGNGYLYVTCGTTLDCITQTGQLYWTTTLYTAPGDPEVSSSPAVGPDGTVFVSTGDYLHALNVTTNPPTGKWKFALSGIDPAQSFISTPAVDAEGNTYVGNGSGYFSWLVSVSPSGSQNWLSHGHFAGDIESSPALDGLGNVYIGVDAGGKDISVGTLYSISCENGSQNWAISPPDNSSIISSPAVDAAGNVYFASAGASGWLMSLNPRNGQTIWKKQLGSVVSSPAIGADGSIYVAAATSSHSVPNVLFAFH